MTVKAPASATRPQGALTVPSKVLALLCAMYFINYIVRVNVSTAATVFGPELHLTNTQVGMIFAAFGYPYLLFQIFGGWIADTFGARKTLTCFAILWSIATVLMGLANSVTGLVLGRVLLGVGVSALPVATRAMSNWTTAERRGFAQGITHACSRLGNAVTPPLVAWLIVVTSWRMSFVIVGLVGVIWAVLWAVYFRDDPAEHPEIARADLERLPKMRVKAAADVPFGPLAARMFPVTLVYFCYGWTLWFFLAWIPSYFQHAYSLKLSSSAFFASGVFLAGTCGDFVGGVVSDAILERTHSRTKARRDLIIFAFVMSAICLLPVLIVKGNLTVAALALSVAFFFAELTIGVFWAIPMDIAPRYSGFASGFMNSGSALAAIVSPVIGGYIVDRTGNWTLTFVAGIALLIFGAVAAFWMRPDKELEEPDVVVASVPSTPASALPGTRSRLP